MKNKKIRMENRLDQTSEVIGNLELLLQEIDYCRQKLAAGVQVKTQRKVLHNIGANIVVHGVRLMKAMK